MRTSFLGSLVGLAVCALWSQAPLADALLYQRSVHLEARSATLIAVHEHDWSKVVGTDSLELRYSARTPFGIPEQVSWVELRDGSGRVIRRISSPPLTHLSISADGRYVVGLSNVKVANITQLLVLDSAGTVRLRRRIGRGISCLAPAEYRRLIARFPNQWARARRFASVVEAVPAWQIGSTVYVDIFLHGSGALRSALQEKVCSLPWAANAGKSVTNFVHWYDELNPEPLVEEKNGEPESLSVRDNLGKRVSIPWKLMPPDTGSARRADSQSRSSAHVSRSKKSAVGVSLRDFAAQFGLS